MAQVTRELRRAKVESARRIIRRAFGAWRELRDNTNSSALVRCNGAHSPSLELFLFLAVRLVLANELTAGIDFQRRLFSVSLYDGFVVPFAVVVVLALHRDDLSSIGFLFDCLLNLRWQ